MSTKKFVGRGIIVAILCLFVLHISEVIKYGQKLYDVFY